MSSVVAVALASVTFRQTPMRMRTLPLLCPLALGCARAPSRQWIHPTPAQWRASEMALAQRRDERPRDPWAGALHVTLRDARAGRAIDGRGGLAVAPGRALRMILVGAAGVTALDVWITRTRWRIAVPPLDLVRRGGLDEPPDLPIGFLRWWFFSPLQGNLFAAEVTSTDRTWLMRDGAAVIELRLGACRRGELLAATRRLRGRAEQVDECRAGDGSTAIRTGDSVRYVDRASGLRVDLVLESVADATPEEGAFRDPDAPGNDP